MKTTNQYFNILEISFFIVCLALLVDHAFISLGYALKTYVWISAFISITVLVILVNAVGKRFGMIDLLAFLAPMLWLLAPALAYHEENKLLIEHEWLQMPVSYQTYFAVALPGTLALLLGIYFPLKTSQFSTKALRELISRDLKNKQGLGQKLIVFGLVSTVVGIIMPQALSFLFSLFSQFMYVGVCYLFFSKSKYKPFYYASVFLFTFGTSVDSGMFGSLIFWAAIIAIVYVISRPINLLTRVALIGIGTFTILSIQSIKSQYRAVAWYGEQVGIYESNSSLFIDLIFDRIENPNFLEDEDVNVNFLSRFNQGRLTGLAIEYTPSHQPFVNGETIFEATLASFVPRVIWPNKPMAGGKENFERFTGQKLIGNTSMNIAPLGDAYVNFGIQGGTLFMFFYGLFFNLFNLYVLKRLKNRPTILFWVGLIWVQAVVVETDVVTVLNHMVKASFLIYISLSISKKVFKVNL